MKIVIDKDVVGELTDDGEIITDDIWQRKLTDLSRSKAKEGRYYQLVRLSKGDTGYVSVVANLLLDNGYGLEE